MVAVAHRPERGHEEPQALLALDEGPAAQVAIVEHEAVEEDADRGPLLRGHRDLARVGERHARLEALEARPPRVVERHDLPVDDEALDGERPQRAHHLRVARGRVLAAPPVEGHALAPALRQHPHPVVLDLEEPRRIREGPLREGGQGEGLAPRVHLAARRAHIGGGRIALIGEAAGFISPSSAEGLSYAFKSALALSSALSQGFESWQDFYRKNTANLRRNIILKNLKSPFMYNRILRKIVMKSGLLSIDMNLKLPLL